MINNWRKLLAGLILVAVAGFIVYNGSFLKQDASPKEEEITLTVLGQVAKPGSYKIKRGSSIKSNMHLFGGFSPDADVSAIDITSALEKDTKITVKKRTGTDNNNYDSLYEPPK